MKNLILLLIIAIAPVVGYAQVVPLEKQNQYNLEQKQGLYFKDVNGVLDKFIGTWHYQNSATNPTEVFDITFYKVEMFDAGGIYSTDELVSRFKLIKNGSVVYDTTSIGANNYFSGSYITQEDLYLLTLSFSEPNSNNLPVLDIPFGTLYVRHSPLSQNPATLTWSAEYFDNGSGQNPFKVPLYMVLTKVN